MNIQVERRLLQVVIGLGALTPIVGGAWGVAGGLAVRDPAADSQGRYLSGLLVGIGLAFWSCLPRIERCGSVFRTLSMLVVAGGLARLASAAGDGTGPAVVLPLVMELGVTPLLLLWRERLQRRSGPLPSVSGQGRRSPTSARSPPRDG